MRNSVEQSVMLLRDTPYGGKLWFMYNIELTAKTRTPPNGRKTYFMLVFIV